MLHRIEVAEPVDETPTPFSAEQALSLFAAAQRGLVVAIGIAVAGWLLYAH